MQPTNDDVLAAARREQKATTRALRGAARDLDESMQMAVAAQSQLKHDNDATERIGNTVDAVASEATLAHMVRCLLCGTRVGGWVFVIQLLCYQLLVRFAKRIYTDKLIIAFSCLVVLLVVLVVLYRYRVI